METIEETMNFLYTNGFFKKEEIRIRIERAKEKVEYLMRYFIGTKYEWQNEYCGVVDWLEDNQCMGLLCSGDVGRGKSLLCTKVIPILLNRLMRKCAYIVDATGLNDPITFRKIKDRSIIVLDDVGTEADYFGAPKFNEIVKSAEDYGKILIITTNLSSIDIEKRYGTRVLSRIISICKCINFKGDDLRKKNFFSIQEQMGFIENPK